MAKRNIRAKAKSAVGVAKQKTQEVKAKINKAAREEQLLHRTLTPKKTISKKEKSAQKHTKLLKRFVEVRKERKEEKSRKNREKTKVVGDLKPLHDALPSLGDIYNLVKRRTNDTTKEPEEPVKLSVKKKIKMKRLENTRKIKSFEKLIKDKAFKQNPREYIANHIRNTYSAMEEEDED